MKLTLAVLCAALAALSQPLMSQDIIAYFNVSDVPYGVNNGYYDSETRPWSHNPNVTVSNLVAHGSVVADPGWAMAYSGWGTAQNPANNISFTVTPRAGETLKVTGFSFALNPYQTPETVTFQWAYRINEGAGFGPWVYSGEMATVGSTRTWTFPSLVTTTGTMEFAMLAADSDSATTLIFPANPKVLGTAGDTSPDPSLHGVISRYTRATTYFGFLPKEASAITYNWDTGTLFTVDDEGTGITELDKKGQAVSGMGMTQLKFPSTYKGDPEGLAYFGTGTDGLGVFMIGAERQNVAILLKYRRNSFDTPNWMTSTPTVVFGQTNGNVGLEGVAYDRADGSAWGIKEKQATSILHATNLGTPSQALTAIDMNDITWRTGISSLSDIYVLGNSAAYAGSDHILILARDQNKIIEITKTGLVVDSLSIANIGRGTIEGLTMDDDGVIYLCSEGSSTIDYSKFSGAMHVLTLPKNLVAGTGGRGVLVGTPGDDEIQGNPAADTITGGAGADTFVYTSMRDGIDTITDFTVGTDLIDVSELLRSIAYLGFNYQYNPLVDGTMRILDSASGALVQIKVSGAYRTLIVLPGLTAAQMNNANNFRFITSRIGN